MERDSLTDYAILINVVILIVVFIITGIPTVIDQQEEYIINKDKEITWLK